MRWLLLVVFIFPACAMADNECPASFDGFISKFERSREFQQTNTIFPLKYSFVDSNASPEPTTVNTILSKSAVAARPKAIFPSILDQKSIPLTKKVQRHSPEKKTIRLYKPDTGYVLDFHFKKVDKCWKLVKFDDFSI